jgi:hypothetical protein
MVSPVLERLPGRARLLDVPLGHGTAFCTAWSLKQPICRSPCLDLDVKVVGVPCWKAVGRSGALDKWRTGTAAGSNAP